MSRVILIGAGLAGLSAAVTLAEQHIDSCLVSAQISERAQSVLAEGGINAALNVMGEQDTVDEHFADTMTGGAQLADPEAVKGLTAHAPGIVRHMAELGVPFAMSGDALIQRNFGGQKKKRTAFCKSSTGKALMTAMIDEARRFEDEGRTRGRIVRYPHHILTDLLIDQNTCTGAVIRDAYSGQTEVLQGPVILACGGPHGMLPGQTTGTTTNDGNGLAIAFSRGVEAANLEFLQYHPTTVPVSGKRLLISEAARGEGGRLYVERDGARWYFMEEKYPELGNLMPRDVVSREIAAVLADPACGDQVWLGLSGLSKEVWKKKLPDLREEVQDYLGIDPAKEPVPVSPGIHYFMGGLYVDSRHRTNIRGLYAAGECACQYHGANRLGGNSLLGALYGGQVAAQTAAEELQEMTGIAQTAPKTMQSAAGSGREEAEELLRAAENARGTSGNPQEEADSVQTSPQLTERVMQILMRALGIVREAETIEATLEEVRELHATQARTHMDHSRLFLAEAMLRSALERKESRGAHQRVDFPDRNDVVYQKTTVARLRDGQVEILLRNI